MRRTELDICRIVACLMVLMIHASADIYHDLPIDSAAFWGMSLISTAVRGAVPVFFMLTGALMLSRETLDTKKLLLRHALYLTGIYYFWSLLYALGSRFAAGSFGSLYDFFYSVAAGHYHLWFLPAMVLCYLFLPPVSAAIHGKRIDPKYLLGLFFGLGLLMANCNLTPDTAPILHRITLNFSLDYLPYLGYGIWGWWLGTKKLPKCTAWLAPLVFLAVTLVTNVGNVWYSGYKGVADGWLFSYFSLPSFLQATCIFCFFLALRDREWKHAKLAAKLADCTLGVYLIHPLMINVLERIGLTVTPAAPFSGLLILFVSLAVICFALVYIAKKIPVIRKLL